MIMKLTNLASFICPLSIAREKPNSCRGLVCPWFQSWGYGHFKIVDNETFLEKMFYCGGGDCPGEYDEDFQYPNHKKEKDERRKFETNREKEERRKKDDLKNKETLQGII